MEVLKVWCCVSECLVESCLSTSLRRRPWVKRRLQPSSNRSWRASSTSMTTTLCTLTSRWGRSVFYCWVWEDCLNGKEHCGWVGGGGGGGGRKNLAYCIKTYPFRILIYPYALSPPPPPPSPESVSPITLPIHVSVWTLFSCLLRLIPLGCWFILTPSSPPIPGKCLSLTVPHYSSHPCLSLNTLFLPPPPPPPPTPQSCLHIMLSLLKCR